MSDTRSILITGANRGIGLELTRQYAAEGWQVYACCRNPEKAEALQALAASAPVQVLALDVNHASQRASLADILQGQAIDILFNNAGVSGGWERQDFGHTDTESWEQTLRSNVIAPLKMMEVLVGHVAASRLRIMANMSSRMGSIADNDSGGRLPVPLQQGRPQHGVCQCRP
ncbi:MAG TPA: SDR family NAD(P)-dependent oxidoreductase [Thiolinea sp.]|nr:SDR family NAD(P)-dependent oxidoreductase [Thiolinea sp.]